MIMSLGFSQENIRMEYIICLKASVILELIRYMCYSDPLKVSWGQNISSSLVVEEKEGVAQCWQSSQGWKQKIWHAELLPKSGHSMVLGIKGEAAHHQITKKRPAGSNASCSELMQNSPTSLLYSPDCQRLAIQWSRNHRNHSCAVQSFQLPKNYFHSLFNSLDDW